MSSRVAVWVILYGVLVVIALTQEGGVSAALLIGIGLPIYALPYIVAVRRGHPQQRAIAALTVLLGWTLIGWAVAMVWASTAIKTSD